MSNGEGSRSTPSRRQKRKRLTDSKLQGLEYIPMQELRDAPGDVLTQVHMGKVYVITKNGVAIAVLSKLPGAQLTIEIDGKGNFTYGL